MPKLTLSVDARVVRDAKRYAAAEVNEAVVRRALMLTWPDFEDAVCAAAAEMSGCEAIVTRDPGGYPGATLPVIDPAAALAWVLAT